MYYPIIFKNCKKISYIIFNNGKLVSKTIKKLQKPRYEAG